MRKITIELRNRVFKRDGHKCVWCGAVGGLTLDHILPKSKGGLNEELNLQTLCRRCNVAKGNRIDLFGEDRNRAVESFYLRKREKLEKPKPVYQEPPYTKALRQRYIDEIRGYDVPKEVKIAILKDLDWFHSL